MRRSLVIFSCLVTVSHVFGQDQGKSEECPPHEFLHSCANSLCGHQECVMIGKPVGCPGVTECIPACVCEDGYLRTRNGTCVPETQCEPQPCPNSYEIYSENISPCAKESCESLAEDYKCDESAPPRAGCACMDQLYVRRKSGAPCDLYMCECPQMANSSWCNPIEIGTNRSPFDFLGKV